MSDAIEEQVTSGLEELIACGDAVRDGDGYRLTEQGLARAAELVKQMAAKDNRDALIELMAEALAPFAALADEPPCVEPNTWEVGRVALEKARVAHQIAMAHSGSRDLVAHGLGDRRSEVRR